jgi:hypothetical protein
MRNSARARALLQPKALPRPQARCQPGRRIFRSTMRHLDTPGDAANRWQESQEARPETWTPGALFHYF